MADSCCNPFNLPRHNWSSRRKNLRSVLEWMCNKADISMGSKICDSGRKKLAKQPDLESFEITESLDQSALPTFLDVPLPDSQYFDGCEAVASVNRCLLEFGETPLSAAIKTLSR